MSDKKKLAIFDLDGTLFNTNDVNYYAYKEAIEEQGFTIDYDYYVNFCNGRHYKVFLPQIMNNDSEKIEIVHNNKKLYYSQFLDKSKINNHLFDIIESLKDTYYLAVVTTASRKNCEEILKYFNKYDLFDLILTHEDITNPKPNPEGFLKAMKHFNMEFSQTMIFEDSDVGIEAAKRTNSTTFCISKF